MKAAAICFEALGDSTRRNIFEKVARGPLAVIDIAKGLPISRPAVSQHLKVLVEAGLVVSHAEGARRIYCVNVEGIEKMRTYLDKFWDQALVSFKNYAEKEE
jgi:DNA-binding transcriptional ArsR family regulator